MKQFLFLLAFACAASSLSAQTIFTYGNTAVSKDEFLKAYNKNKPVVTDKAASLKEYLDLFIKFKLKVKAAADLHLDTLPNLIADLQNFRGQIEETYLNDQKEINLLVQEAFNRSQKDIHIVHLFIPLNSVLPADTNKILNEAQTVFKELSSTNASFQDVAKKLNDRSIPATWGDVGFITIFTLPYEFENIVYQLRPGLVSKPFRTKSGYHIFKNIEERKASGKMNAAQILFAMPPGASESLKAITKKQIDSIYKVLLAGANFNEMAKALSNDKLTYMNGGIMPEFGTGKFDETFEKNAFALQHDSDITPLFETAFGYHIVKRLSRIPVSTDKSDEANLHALEQQVKQDDRIQVAKEKFAKTILSKLGYKKNNSINEKDLWFMTDSFTIGILNQMPGYLNEKTILFSFNTGSVKVGDWLNYVKDYKNASGLYKGESYPELMKKYVAQTATEFYRKKLQDYSPEFKYQLQEFKDGNMLFEVMERNVWSKASDDSLGLQNYYARNKEKYFWELSADAILITCANEKLASDVAAQLRNGKSWKQLTTENANQVQTDSGRFELSQIPVRERTNFTEGLVTAPVVNAADRTTSFAKIIKLYPANQPRAFEEARGLVINDYQNFLEEKWIDRLKKKYPVKVNEQVFNALLK